MANNQLIGTIRNNGELRASIQLVPNEKKHSKRVEIYDLRGRLMAYQTLDWDVTDEFAGQIAFALYNGFEFGTQHLKYQMRKNFEAILLDEEHGVDTGTDTVELDGKH